MPKSFHTIATWSLVIFVILATTLVDVNGQSPVSGPAPGPATVANDCMTLIYNMSDCLTYVEKGSNATKPDKPCCQELAGMLDSNPICLCQLLGKSKDLPIELDTSKALKLPKVCGIQTPPLSLCSEVGIPIGSPAGSPTSAEGPSSLMPGMSPMGGEPTSAKNGASSAYFSVAYLVVGLTVAFRLLTL